MTRVEEHHWQPDPPVAPRGWYPDPPMLRYWTGEAWTDEVRPARPPVPATPVEVEWQPDVDAWGSPERRVGLRALSQHPAGAERPGPPPPPEPMAVAPARQAWAEVEELRPVPPPPPEPMAVADPWQARSEVEEIHLLPPVPPEPAGSPTPPTREEGTPRLLWEVTKFALVALLALVAGGLVAAVGIALTV